MKMEATEYKGFFIISAKAARKLDGGHLPDHGNESLVVHDGQHYWMGRTMHNGKQCWSLRATEWHLENGNAVLGGNLFSNFRRS